MWTVSVEIPPVPWRAELQCRQTWTEGVLWQSRCCRWFGSPRTRTAPRSVNTQTARVSITQQQTLHTPDNNKWDVAVHIQNNTTTCSKHWLIRCLGKIDGKDKQKRAVYLQSLGSVDGSERPEHSQHSEDLDHRDRTWTESNNTNSLESKVQNYTTTESFRLTRCERVTLKLQNVNKTSLLLHITATLLIFLRWTGFYSL